MIVTPYTYNIDKLFEGIMIPSTDKPSGHPGWKCKECGWTIGSIGLPPSHICPDDGDKQSRLSPTFYRSRNLEGQKTK